MRQSNGYIIIFSLILTVVCGGLLAGVYSALSPEHKRQEQLDKKKQILNAYEALGAKDNVEDIFSKSIKGIIVNTKGEIISKDSEAAFAIEIAKECKKSEAERQLPVFMHVSDVDTSTFDAYIIPVYGNGLWDKIWGYVAIQSDCNTLQGAVFGHKGETPGLGARITETEKDKGEKAFPLRFRGKQIFDGDEKLVSVEVRKGEKNPDVHPLHEVDGLSGASMTTQGVNAMLKDFFGQYEPFLKSQKQAAAQGGSSKKVDYRNHIK